jgi:DNA transformation protein and related proteins
VPVSKGFVAHALDLLGLLGAVQARPMFGGYGLYAGGGMFGLLDDDELYLKVDGESRAAFLDAGCRQWVYLSPKGPMPGNYYRPPDDAHEEPEAMLPWARLALGAADRAARAKKAKASRPRPAARKRAAGSAARGARRRRR